MKKLAHRLKAGKATRAPKWVIFFDTETNETQYSECAKKLTLKYGYACLTRYRVGKGFVKNSECEFTDTDTFNRWLDSVCVGKERYYVTAHNLGFDVRVTGVLAWLASHGWERKGLIVEGINFIARYRRKDTTITFLNNQQLFNVSLATLGDSIGIPKLSIDFAACTDEQLRVYCKRDVDVMVKAWDIWIEFVRRNDLGSFRMTAASQAMGAFKHRFLDGDIMIHNSNKVVALERESYHGGRVEAFFLGKYPHGKVYNLDVNSMYPAIMKAHAVPVRLRRYYESIPRALFERVRHRFGYIVEATLDIERPVLPMVKDGRLIFPVGRVVGAFTRPELEAALRNGTLRSVSRCALYDERVAFAPFVDFFYGARLKFREEGNTEFAYLSKLLLNSLYGKFGQKQSVYKVVGKTLTTPDGFYKSFDALKDAWVKYRVIDGIVERAEGDEEGFDSFVAIASYITAAARVLLAEYIEKAGWANVLYCDTDSLFVNDEGFARLRDSIDDSVLGKLKLVGETEECTIFGAKWYRFGESTKCKGIRRSAEAVGENAYRQEKFVSFVGGLHTGVTDGVIVETVTKRLSTEYRKGELQPDGRVLPFVLSA